MNKRHNFNSFLKEKPQKAPRSIEEALFEKVSQDLGVHPLYTWSKFTLIHTFIATVSLLFCPQFNLSLSGKKDLYHYFHQTLGHEGCMIVCGAIFLSSGALASAFLLKRSEVLHVRQSLMLAFTLLALVSLGIFFIFGAQIYLDLAGPWLLGAIMGGATTFNLSKAFRESFA